MKIWGINKKYKSLSWWENFMGGHINIGKKITIFGENAMHWAIQLYTKKFRVIVFTLPIRTFGRYWGCHLYFSPDGTPSQSIYCIGLGKKRQIETRIRKYKFGHNFKTNERDFNNIMDQFLYLNNK